MAVSDDHVAGPEGASRQHSGWRSAGGRAAFWSVAIAGVLVLCAAWAWYGLAYSEEMTDSAGGPTTGAGIGMSLGTVPVIAVHGLLLLVLALIGAMSHVRPWVGLLLAVFVVAVESGVGIAVNQVLWAGCLFAMSADQLCPAYIP